MFHFARRSGRASAMRLVPALSVVCLAVAASAADPSSLEPSASDLNARLGVTDSRVVSLPFLATPDEHVRLMVPVDDVLRAVRLHQVSVRAEGYVLYEARPDGSLRAVEPGPVNTYRGVVEGLPGSAVAASWRQGQWQAMIITPEGERIAVEPLSDHDDRAAADEHVVYRVQDLHARQAQCGLSTVANEPQANDGGAGPGGGIAGKGTDLCLAELGCDADFTFFSLFGDLLDTEADIMATINAVNMQYEQQVGITHLITGIIVRTSAAADPYTAFNSFELVCEFSLEWSQNVAIPRDLAHLFTDRVTGADIGRAAEVGSICESESCPFFPCVCNPQFGTEGSYAFSRTKWDPAFACGTDVVAHQLGHLWGAVHCNCPGFTMNPFSTCANQFSAASIAAIEAYRDTVPCLDCGTNPNCPGEGSCFESNGTVGCFDETCCNIVCAIDPFCCDVIWDGLCAKEALGFCDQSCGHPNAGDCTIPNGTPYCDDFDCCVLICGFDPFCCDVEWDQICADEAIKSCDLPPPNDNCEDALPIFNGDTIYDLTGATAQTVDECFIDLGPGGPSSPDIWYDYTADFTGDLVVSVCGDGHAAGIEIYAECACPPEPGALLACAICNIADDLCFSLCRSEAVVPVATGQCLKIRIFGTPAEGTGTISISKLPIGPPNDLCENALPLANGETPYSMEGAGGEIPILCDDPKGGLMGPGIFPDVWFTYDADFDGQLTIEVCTLDDFNAVEVYGTCVCPPTSDDCLGFNSCKGPPPPGPGGDCPSGCLSQLTIDVVNGQCYLIRVFQKSGFGGGTITLTKTIPSCPDARLDFGETPTDFGSPEVCFAGAVSGELTTQYVQTQSIIFGTAVDNFKTTGMGVLLDAACDPPCRSAVFNPDFGDWWCQFRIGTEPGVPGPLAGVTQFSAELCPITEGNGGSATMTGYNNNRIIVAETSSTGPGTETLTITAPKGELIAYVQISQSGGVSVDCLSYPDPIERVFEGCPWDCGDGNGVVDIVDLLALLGGWDEPGGCDIDGNNLINIVDLLALLSHWGDCPIPDACVQGSGDCFAAHPGTGCVDQDCCGAVCAVDPFCCEVEWDQICADEAIASCAQSCGHPDAGDCFIDNGTPFCSDFDCCNSVCAIDPFCCNTAWDQICADEALDMCQVNEPLTLDPGAAFPPTKLGQNSNDGYNLGRGVVFTADEAITVNGATLYLAEAASVMALFELYSVISTSGDIQPGAVLLRSRTQALFGPLDFHGTKFAPVTLTPGQSYLLRVSFPEDLDELWYHQFDQLFDGPVDIGPVTIIDGTSMFDTANTSMPVMQLLVEP